MRHALVIAFHYPPEASSSGVLRTLKFTRYLPDYGWRATVVTLRRDAYETTDPGLEAQIPEAVRVVRTGYLNTKRHLAVGGRYPALLATPDRWIGWLPWAVAAGRRILREDPAQIVYSTSPHATAHLIGARLSRAAGLPWVTDFRDPWYEEPPEPGTPAIVHWSSRRLERNSIARASHVVTSTAHLGAMLRGRYPGEPAGKFTTIVNGFDEADFGGPRGHRPRGDGKLLFVHTGNINAQFRDPRPLFRAIRALDGRIDTSALAFRFIGAGEFGESAAMSQCLAETGLTSRVAFLPRTAYAAALDELAQADVGLLLQASEDTTGLVPAKLYEYLRSGKPVLALTLPGASAEVLAETSGGWAVNPLDGSALSAALLEIHRFWSAGTLERCCAKPDALAPFDRRRLTGKLADIFQSLAAKD
ncbi:MAG: glycosyltransferase [Betaproteobacteria bacterium]|nr:glycosyltransferase [Betaproteobacteria bacterium]